MRSVPIAYSFKGLLYLSLSGIIVSSIFALDGCRKDDAGLATKHVVWTERELFGLVGKTRDEIRSVLGTPNGFYTRNTEGRWHYSSILVDAEGAGPPKRVWVVVYFSKIGEQPATLVEIHEHLREESP